MHLTLHQLSREAGLQRRCTLCEVRHFADQWPQGPRLLRRTCFACTVPWYISACPFFKLEITPGSPYADVHGCDVGQKKHGNPPWLHRAPPWLHRPAPGAEQYGPGAPQLRPGAQPHALVVRELPRQVGTEVVVDLLVVDLLVVVENCGSPWGRCSEVPWAVVAP